MGSAFILRSLRSGLLGLQLGQALSGGGGAGMVRAVGSFQEGHGFLKALPLPVELSQHSLGTGQVQEALKDKKINFFPMGIGSGADIQALKKYTKDGNGMVLRASKENFQEAFVWLSSSMSVISRSDPSMDKVDLDPLPRSITVEL